MANSQNSSEEIWRAIPTWESLYEASNLGRVRSLPREITKSNRWGTVTTNRVSGRVLRPAVVHGHELVVLSASGRRESVFVHRLILSAFVSACPLGHECRHLDGNGRNNRLENLAWGTRAENFQDRKRLGEHGAPRGELSGRAKLTRHDVFRIREMLDTGMSFAAIARIFAVNRGTIGKIKNRTRWGWL